MTKKKGKWGRIKKREKQKRPETRSTPGLVISPSVSVQYLSLCVLHPIFLTELPINLTRSKTKRKDTEVKSTRQNSPILLQKNLKLYSKTTPTRIKKEKNKKKNKQKELTKPRNPLMQFICTFIHNQEIQFINTFIPKILQCENHSDTQNCNTCNDALTDPRAQSPKRCTETPINIT